ncbi:WD40 repeat domain-containing protein [Candidatus Poribacteria bacterium]|nr:WD40 repeat domain-containing protein [Candidatus Poribacteria bacterium]MBT5534225.1 WD40 repeat domain-containing protein [Candidatus Poribacteria bacterium]MBT5711186.1 WD40 repeat domain-containing protein [Candidatus Poribacteria bacterium]MBT7099433.1 WD40 repeat domain-containing protein [Candidatus Poribacteria bacterium]MBT7807078.1 WD40 repeat domain-containing protein [Candidatus Poribacteria bacterium]
MNDDGSRLLCHYLRGPVRLWDVGRAETLLEIPVVRHSPHVALTGRGRLVVAAHESGEVVVYSAATGTETQRFQAGQSGTQLLDASPILPWIVVHDGDNVLRVWDADSGSCTHEIGRGYRPVDYASLATDGSRLAGATAVRVRVWDLATGEDRAASATAAGPALSPDGRRLLVAHTEHTDPHPSGHDLWDVERLDRASNPAALRVAGYDRLRAPRWLADGRIVGFGNDGRAEIWQADEGLRHRKLPARSRAKVSAVGAGDRRLLTYDDVAGVARIWDIDSGREVATIATDWPSSLQAVAYSDDGSTIAFSSIYREVEVWRSVGAGSED